MMRPTERRRRPTRWLLVAAVAGVALLLVGTEALLRAAPTVDRSALRVEGVPALAMAETRSCTRQQDDLAIVEEIRFELLNEGRISSGQVYACPIAFDGLRVTYVGEAVGEVIPRRDGAWLQVNDDDYALDVGPISGHRDLRGFNSGLSVWLPDGLHEQIEGVGRPERRGDVIQVTGVLLRADPADGGGITLRADQLEVLAPSVEVPEPFHAIQAIVAAVLVVLAGGAGLWARDVRRR
jgi:hypothetical protein